MDNLREFLLSFDYTNDREVRFIPKDKPLGSTTAYLTIPEIATISATVNDAGAILMTYYYRKTTTPKFDFFNDTTVSTALGWTVRKTAATRQLLVKAGWIKRVIYTQPTTKSKITIFYLGKEMCDKVLTPEEYTTSINKRAALQDKQNQIANQLGMSWDSVMKQYSSETVMESLGEI